MNLLEDLGQGLLGMSDSGPPTYTNASLHLLPQTAGTLSPAALDGSPYGFYFQPSPTGSKRWTISIEGGGWCYNEGSCWHRSKTHLGTSKNLPRTGGRCTCMNVHPSAGGDGQLVDDCNCVRMAYLDGASFSGYRAEPWPVPGSPNNETLYFRGIKNLDATLDFLLWQTPENGMDQATEVVVTGISAGALSTFLHLDRIAQAVHTVKSDCRVYGAPMAGYFLDHATFPGVTPTPATPSNYTDEMAYIYNMQNLTFGTDGGLTKACESAFPDAPHYCFMSPHMHTLIEHPFYVFNSKFDSWQLNRELQIYNWTTDAAQAFSVIAYGMDFLDQFRSVLEQENGNGGFVTSCICHGGCNWHNRALDDGSHNKHDTTGRMSPIEHYALWANGERQGMDSFFVDESIIPNQDAKLNKNDRCFPFYAGAMPSDVE